MALPGLRAFAPITVEQPLPAEAAIGEWQRLGTAVKVPIAADESLSDPDLASGLAQAGIGLAIKLATLGGPRAAVALARRAQAPVWVASSYETSIGIAAAIHAACAFPHDPPACGLGTLGLLEADL